MQILLLVSGDHFVSLALSYTRTCCIRLNMFEFLDRYCCYNAKFLIAYAQFVESEGDPTNTEKNTGCINDYRYANRILQDSWTHIRDIWEHIHRMLNSSWTQ